MNDTNFKDNLNDLKNIFTARSSTDSKLSYNTGFTVNGQDLTELFLPFTVNPAAANTGYIVQSQGKDLSEIFQNINDPLTPYTISDKSNIEVTTITDNGYTGLIFENNSSLGSTGTCNIVINLSTINVLVVGGGGGGACGNFNQYNGGCGGGGSGIIYHENLSITSGNTFKISVGAGGTGRKVSNGGNGGSAGSSGIASSFTDNVVNLSTIQTTYTSGGSTIVQGNQGWGSGTTFGYGGGVGGSVNNNASGAQGGGGGGGGGAADSLVIPGEPPAKVTLASPYLGYE